MNFRHGDIIYFVLQGGLEVIGSWGSQDGVEDDYFKLSNACFAGTATIQTPEGPRQVKVLMPADERGDFSKEMFVYRSAVVLCRTVIELSEFYRNYIKATTTIKPPTLAEELIISRRKN